MEGIREAEHEDICTLLEKAGTGDREAFKAVVRLYQQKVFLLAYSFLRNREDAMDIVQETFLKLYQKLSSYEKDRNFQAWLLQIARNLSIDHYRKHAKSREVESEKNIDELNPGALDGHSGESSVELRQIFSRCLEKLGERQRMIFVLKHYNGLQYNEIAQVLNISVGTVKSLHFKAVRKMKTLLSPQLGYQT